MNVLFWGWHFETSERPYKNLKILFIAATAIIITLGIIMEYVQMYFIPNRSLDGYDLIADLVASVLAALCLFRSSFSTSLCNTRAALPARLFPSNQLTPYRRPSP